MTASRRVEADSQPWQVELTQDTPLGSPWICLVLG